MARKPRHPAYTNPESASAPAIRLPAYGSPQAEPSPPAGEPPSHTPPLRLPAVDDRLARPEEGEEYVDGEYFGWQTMAGDPEHADPQCQLSYVVRACVAPGYIASTELLTRTDKDSDFATDVCIRRQGQDPETGGRYLEEVSFEVANSQTLPKLEKRAWKLVKRGVRRVFGIMVKRGEILEWTLSRGVEVRPLAGEIRDRVFKKPLRIRAILDAAEADRLVVEALWEKREPNFVRFVEKREAKREARGEARGLARAILSAFQVHGITLDTENRQAVLDCEDTALLGRWLDKALRAESAADIVAELEELS